ncbi:hypothetical protein NYY69_13235, partial [Acinetobacter baumannii]|nr:hypothetical protein [Acinetobacter baumannii]
RQVGHLISRVICISLFYQNSTCFFLAYFLIHHPLSNWAVRRIGRVGFEVINMLPIPSLINHLIRDIPGIQRDGHRMWFIDLEQAGFIDFINNRSWMVEKLLNLTDFSILPGLNILRESRELVQQLVDQFEIKGLRVQSGRLEVQVGIAN